MSNAPLVEILNPLMHNVGEVAVSLLNAGRRNASLDYIQIQLPASMPLLPDRRNIIEQRLVGKAPLSLMELEMRLRRIAEDPRPKGVILEMRGLAMSVADLQTLRDMIQRLRHRGKKVICFAQGYDNASYYVASAADTILLQRGGVLQTSGLVQQQTFLKDGLETVGLSVDSVAISPYKGAADRFTRTEPSEEGKAQTNWLLDSTFEMLITDIAAGREMDSEAVRAMFDGALYTDREALAAGYVDDLLNEEQFQDYLGTEHIALWQEAENILMLRMPPYSEKYVAILPLYGMIVPGESENPPVDIPLPLVGGQRMGDITVVQQVRNLMRDPNAAAVVLLIDSGGGSASASEAMTSALDELSKDRPVVACMSGVAASGGYYIATPADHIVAQPGTITGSIGVIAAKLITTEALKKLHFNPYYYSRGENARMFAPEDRFTEVQREKMVAFIERTYDQFLERVANARKMKPEAVDQIGGGRVWTGQQAHDNGLVDELGGLYEAVKKARSMAGLPDETPVGIVRGKQKPLAAQIAERAQPAASVAYWYESLSQIANGSAQMLMPFEIKTR